MPSSIWSRLVAVAALVGVVAVLPASNSVANTSVPGVRLLAVLHHISVTRYPGERSLYVSPGIYLASTDGAFEIDAFVSKDGSVTLWQVRRDSQGAHRIRPVIAPGPVNLLDGLPGFLHLVLRDATGQAVSHRKLPLCLGGGYGMSRVDGTGPDSPTYPQGCGSPLSQAAVWGIDQGWASSLALDVPTHQSPDGVYTLLVKIAPAYVRQLHIPAALATATVQLTLKTFGARSCISDARPCALPSQGRAGGSGTGAGEGPSAGLQPAGSGTDGVHDGNGGVPDLRALPAHDLSTDHNGRNGHDYLDFGATIWNAGSGPLVVEGFRNGDTPVMPATQYIYRDGRPVRAQVVGQFEFDRRRGHHHWHMEDIAQYDLLTAAGTRVVLSDKQSFCLAPTDPIDLTGPGAQWAPDQQRLWSACSGADAIWLREVLPAGWGDTYYQSVAGQSFDITNVPNGYYQVRVTTNPAGRLLETSYDNNAALVPIVLRGTPGDRRVHVVG